MEVLGAEVVGRYNWGGDTTHRVGPHGDVRVGKDVISLFLGDPTSSTPRLVHHARGIGEEPVALGQRLVAYTRCVGIPPAGLDLFLARSSGVTRLTRLTCPGVGLRAHPSRMTPCLARRLDARRWAR